MKDMCANMLSSLQARVEHVGCLQSTERAEDMSRHQTYVLGISHLCGFRVFAHVFVSKDPGTCRFEEICHGFCSHCQFHPTLGHCRAMLREGLKHT